MSAVQLYKYNTPNFRKLFKQMHERYVKTDKETQIEPHVRMLCDLVHLSGYATPIYSCDGHPTELCEDSGYVMFIARNRDDSTKLVQCFQEVSRTLVEEFGWEAVPNIEHSIAFLADEVAYPTVVFRTPCFTDELTLDLYWYTATRRIYNLLKHHIALRVEPAPTAA